MAQTDGAVLPPAEVIAWYRAHGWWADTLLTDPIRARAAECPYAEAVVDGARRVTYRQLIDMVDGLAAGLVGVGLRPGDRVLVRLPNSLDLITTLLALVGIGAPPVLAVAALRDREMRHVAMLAAPRAMVVHIPRRGRYSLDLARRLRAELPSLTHVFAAGDGPADDDTYGLATLARPAATSPVHRPAPDDVAFCLLSSGTAGLPKPVPRTHQDYGHLVRVQSELCRVDRDTVLLAALPMAHTLTLGCPGVLGVLAAGGRVVVGQPEPSLAVELIERERATMTACVPALAVQFVAAAARTGRDVSSLRLIQVGGARLAAHQAQQIMDGLGCHLQQVYGMSEGLQNSTRLDDPPEVVTQTQGRPASPGTEWRIVGPDGTDVAPGEPGELWARGPHMARAYLASSGVNAEAFTPDGYLRTGDVVRLHGSGNLVFEGRSTDFVNVGGEKVSCVEVQELLSAHPAVTQCAVVAMPHAELGEAVCAFVALAAGATLTLRDVRAFLDECGAARFKFPARLELLAALPTTATGKPDTSALRAQAVGAR